MGYRLLMLYLHALFNQQYHSIKRIIRSIRPSKEIAVISIVLLSQERMDDLVLVLRRVLHQVHIFHLPHLEVCLVELLPLLQDKEDYLFVVVIMFQQRMESIVSEQEMYMQQLDSQMQKDMRSFNNNILQLRQQQQYFLLCILIEMFGKFEMMIQIQEVIQVLYGQLLEDILQKKHECLLCLLLQPMDEKDLSILHIGKNEEE